MKANAVYRLGQFEYGYNFRNAPDSARWATLHYGAYLLELAANLRTAMEGRPGAMLYRHNVAHDGSMSSLLGLLQIETMVWPGQFSSRHPLQRDIDVGRSQGWGVKSSLNCGREDRRNI